MGTLKPGATYIYERADGIIYAREFGKTERKEIGRSYDTRTNDGRPLHDHIMEDKMWSEIRLAAQTNPALQEALDCVKVLYELSKDE
jgi:hypothetical protein